MRYVHSAEEAADALITEVEETDLAIVVFPTREAFVLSIEEGRERLLFGGFDDIAGPTFAIDLRSGWNRGQLVRLISAALPRSPARESSESRRIHVDGASPN